MDRDRKIELLESLKNGQVTIEESAKRIRNDGKTIFHVVIKKVDGTYSCGGRIYTKKEMKKLKLRVKPDRRITVCPAN